MICFSHPTGNPNVRQAALALAEAGLLAEFWTCLAPSARAPWIQALPGTMRAHVLRRALPESLHASVHTRPWLEAGRLASGMLGRNFDFLSVDAVYHDLDRATARQVRRRPATFSAVYAYEDGAQETFRAAREAGIVALYDLPIGYWRVWRELMDEERNLVPEWSVTLQGAADGPAKLARKDEELRLAKAVFVASSFTRQTLLSAPDFDQPIHVIPYGAPSPSLADPVGVDKSDAPLRVLFVGALSQRKGLSYLLKAIELVGSAVALTMIGRKTSEECLPLNAATRKHRWLPSLSHPEILEEMRRHDVFVFPSLFEGFGLVILEAMSQGLPVITTPHTGGPDVICDGVEGFIVSIRSSEALAEKLEILAGDRNRLQMMKIAARDQARQLTWANYKGRLAAEVRAALKKD